MSIAITDDHRALADTVSDLLAQRRALSFSRALLDGAAETNPPFYGEAAGLGWLGLHLPEEFGGSGYGLEEAVVIAEELGRGLAPGAFIPTIIAGAVISACGTAEQKARLLPGLADGSVKAGIALAGDVHAKNGVLHGNAGTTLGAGLADIVLVGVGDDVAVVATTAPGVTVSVPANLDPTRQSGRVAIDGATGEVLAGSRSTLIDLARLILAAEATGIARACTVMAAEYAKVRIQFGRPIATYQAVKHHCANMAVATELATAAVWDAARASAAGGAVFSFAAANATSLAFDAAVLCANLNTQVHGGIGYTWEHDAHLYLRRATALGAIADPQQAALDSVAHTRAGVRRAKTIELPPEAEPIRDAVREFARSIAGQSAAEQRTKLIETGYVMPHWPTPWGRAAGAVEQIVIEQEFAAAGVQKPAYGITGWVILTLIQHATADQVSRWVLPALRQDVIWCQLFSEPDAGSDAAGVKTKATRVDGGWLVSGQKVWTSGAHLASFGFMTVRTNPDVKKHQGITMMVVDMHAKGVEVRPLKQASGGSEFNEVFFNDVFVPDDDVVGPVDGGWTVARATLGNESVSIGGGDGGASLPAGTLVGLLDGAPERLPGGAGRVGRYIATQYAMGMMNLRTASRAVSGGGPGPEGAITKLVLSELGHDAAGMATALAGPDTAFLDGQGEVAGLLAMSHRGLSIAGGTSEIKRNQIGEHILGLPRDPLIK
ncbi:MAG: acyl-CoA dehydrogenase [Actinomycetota bacterium]|nr:acyl-CoA dehydrogenase [Actinomycetota bacterium]